MKKLLLFSIITIISCAAKAQIGIQAGATFYSLKASVDNISIKYDTKVGFTAGILYSIPIANNFSFTPALNFTQKGGKYNSQGISDNITINYLEMPLNVLYHFSKDGNGFFIGAGPDFGWGISGKEKSSLDSLSDSHDIKFGKDGDLKPFEFSANILAGYKLSNGLFIAANYNPGISDIAPDDPGVTGGKFHNNGFAIRIGYIFGSAKPIKQ